MCCVGDFPWVLSYVGGLGCTGSKKGRMYGDQKGAVRGFRAPFNLLGTDPLTPLFGSPYTPLVNFRCGGHGCFEGQNPRASINIDCHYSYLPVSHESHGNLIEALGKTKSVALPD